MACLSAVSILEVDRGSRCAWAVLAAWLNQLGSFSAFSHAARPEHRSSSIRQSVIFKFCFLAERKIILGQRVDVNESDRFSTWWLNDPFCQRMYCQRLGSLRKKKLLYTSHACYVIGFPIGSMESRSRLLQCLGFWKRASDLRRPAF